MHKNTETPPAVCSSSLSLSGLKLRISKFRIKFVCRELTVELIDKSIKNGKYYPETESSLAIFAGGSDITFISNVLLVIRLYLVNCNPEYSEL